MVPHAAPRPGFGNPRWRRHGPWNGSAAVVEFSGSSDAGNGFGPDPDAAGNHEARDRCATASRPRVLGERAHEPTKLHVHVLWLYCRVADHYRLRDLHRATRKETAPGAGPREADARRGRKYAALADQIENGDFGPAIDADAIDASHA